METMDIMETDIGKIYQKICLKHEIPIDESILSCFNNVCVHYGELNLSKTKITETAFLCIIETLRLVDTIKILNLSDCLLSFNGLKNFLDVLNEFNNLSQLNLKGNKIENHVTTYISKILFHNTNITELQLNWNNLGNSVETFAKLCNSLIFNTVLNTLNLANNNLCHNCGFHFAKMLNTNKCLKYIDLSWNHIGETGALPLMESLKNNGCVLEMNIQCNSISLETSTMIAKQLEQNWLNKINLNNVQTKNQNILNNQYKNQIDSLMLELCHFQEENIQLKQELNEMKNNNLKDEANNKAIVDKVKTELLSEKQKLKLFVEKISDNLSHSDLENISSLEDLEKITYIIKRIQKIKINEAEQCLEKTKVNKILSDTLPIITDQLNIVKKELKTIKTLIEIEIKTFLNDLSVIEHKFTSNIFCLQLPNQSIRKMFSKLVLKQQDEMNTSIEQTKMLVLLNSSLKTLYHEKIDLEIKIAKEKTQSVVSFQTNQALENSLKLAKEKIKKLKNEQESNKVAQDKNTKFYTEKFDKLLNTLFEKEQQLQMYHMEKQKMITSHLTEISTLKNQLQTEKQMFKEQKKQDQEEIEELCKMLPQYFKKLLKKDDPENKKNF